MVSTTLVTKNAWAYRDRTGGSHATQIRSTAPRHAGRRARPFDARHPGQGRQGVRRRRQGRQAAQAQGPVRPQEGAQVMDMIDEVRFIRLLSEAASDGILNAVAAHTDNVNDLRAIAMSALDMVVIDTIDALVPPKGFEHMLNAHAQHVQAGLRMRADRS